MPIKLKTARKKTAKTSSSQQDSKKSQKAKVKGITEPTQPIANDQPKGNPMIDLPGAIDRAFRETGYGGRGTIYLEQAKGINFIMNGNTVQPNKVSNGICFFTRPLLNLTYGNLSRKENLFVYRDSPEYSYGRMVRVLLDPKNALIKGEALVKDGKGLYIPEANQAVRSPLVDNLSPFINILTNNLMSLSGWQDSRLDHYATDKGIRNEQWIMADGVFDVNESFTIDTTFLNQKGDPVLMLFDLWCKYMDYVHMGYMLPYPEMIALRELDYMSRIYSFTLDETRTYLTHWASTGAGFPTNVPNGKIHDFDYSNLYKDSVQQINISWQCVGADYNDIRTLYEFNKLVGMFNPDLDLYWDGSNDGEVLKNITDDRLHNIPQANAKAGGNNSQNAVYLKLEPNEKALGNMHAYPLINLYTKELEWWIHRADYMQYVMGVRDENILKQLKRRPSPYRSTYGNTDKNEKNPTPQMLAYGDDNMTTPDEALYRKLYKI